ncbi:MAG: magnesium transporter CorA family protein [Alphaproteobacteria bacterium]
MITVYYKQNGSISVRDVGKSDVLPPDSVWIDIYNPTLEEEKNIEGQLGIEIPTKEEVWKNQVLNRFYQENGVSYMTAALITKVDSPYPQTSSVTFILSEKYLVTIRYINPTSFQNFSTRLLRYSAKFPDGAHVLEGLLEEIITRVAYNSEIVVDVLDQLSHDIFNPDTFQNNKQNPSQLMQAVLRRLGTCADLNSKINESLHSLSRMVNYFETVHIPDKDIDSGLRTLTTDVMSLTKQTAFLSDKITFQLDATLGMINVEQNMIIKIFSVVAVFFLPPTLVSGIYGMNFQSIPELEWAWGYPYALFLITMCVVIPFLYFRKKKLL